MYAFLNSVIRRALIGSSSPLFIITFEYPSVRLNVGKVYNERLMNTAEIIILRLFGDLGHGAAASVNVSSGMMNQKVIPVALKII